ncbi:MAG TPA: hypothetical protein VIX91_01565 [Candidatus Acidoferrum sp.]
MIQFLHIFKKDVRRHWPEILISLALLALYTRQEVRLWQTPPEYNSISTFFFVLSGPYIPFFLTLSWIFLILRVVQSETLVGDRQWWVTKPYDWWQLLLSKLFFILVFISVPLFSVQLFLLHHAGFSILTNLGHLFLMQFTLPLVLFVSAFALASLTRNLPQALLGIGILVVVLIIGLWLDSLSSHMTGDSPEFVDTLELLLVFGSITLVPVWQFARRKTWASRITIAASIGAATGLSLIPFGSRVEQSYPLLATKDSPAQFAFPPIPESQDNPSGLPGFVSDTLVSIPVNVSGVAPGSVVLIYGMKITVDSSDDSHWTRGWVSQYGQLWPGSQRQNLSHEVKRKEYEKIKAKPLNLHIQLALSEYQEVDARSLVLPATTFRDIDLGICRLVTVGYQLLECRKPFHSPAYMGRFDAPNSPCGSVRRFPNSSPSNLDVAYAWAPPTDEMFSGSGLNPIVDYQLTFNPVSRIPDTSRTSPVEYSVVTLCPGAEIRLARPVFKRHLRIQLELPAVRLQDIVERDAFGGGGVSIDLRSPI